MKFQLVYLLILISTTLNAQQNNSLTPKEVIHTGNLSIPVYDFDSLEPIFQQSNDSTYVINFWATWCAPCVQELPYFEKLLSKYKEEKLSVKLVSLDFKNKIDKSLIPYLHKNNLDSEVILLDDTDANRWINLVDSNWSGALPATIIYNKESRAFYEKSFNFEELETEYLKIIKKQ